MFSFLGKAIGAVVGVAGKIVGLSKGKTSVTATVNWQKQLDAQNKIIAQMKTEAAEKSKSSTMILIVVGAVALVIVFFVLLKK